MTPAHCEKSHLKEIILRTKEKQLLQGRRYANQLWNACSCHIWVPQLVYFDKIHHVPSLFSHFSQICKGLISWCLVTFVQSAVKLLCNVHHVILLKSAKHSR
jgi:thymidylate synthase ThyX